MFTASSGKKRKFMCIINDDEDSISPTITVVCQNFHETTILSDKFLTIRYKCKECERLKMFQKFEESSKRLGFSCVSPDSAYIDKSSPILFICNTFKHLVKTNHKSLLESNNISCEGCIAEKIQDDFETGLPKCNGFEFIEMMKFGKHPVLRYKCVDHNESLRLSYDAYKVSDNLKIYCKKCRHNA